jgi:anti-anti-sigma regulatory factor
MGQAARSQAGFGVTVDTIAGVLLIALTGRLDRRAARQLGDCPQLAALRHRPVVVDLSDVTAFDRASVDALIAARRRLGVRLRLAAPRARPALRALGNAGVAHTFALHASPAAAAPRPVPVTTNAPPHGPLAASLIRRPRDSDPPLARSRGHDVTRHGRRSSHGPTPVERWESTGRAAPRS